MGTVMLRLFSILTLTLAALPIAAQEAAQEEPRRGLLDPHAGLMFWTLLIFVALWLVLRRYAFPAIFAAVEARERALEEAIASAKRDREEAAKLLEEQDRKSTRLNSSHLV